MNCNVVVDDDEIILFYTVNYSKAGSMTPKTFNSGTLFF
jgi:hypothetical protein